MKRAGSTVQYQLVAEIVERMGLGKRVGFVDQDNVKDLLAATKDRRQLFVAKAHDFFDDFYSVFARNEVKVVYVYRDIRDVAVSLMAKKGNNSFWRLFISGDIEDILYQYQKWTSTSPVLISRYEYMVQDLSQEVGRIAEFLGIDLDNASTGSLAEEYSMQNQLQRIDEIEKRNEGLVLKGKKNQYWVDPKTLLNQKHIRSGASEQWRNKLSPFQIGLLEYVAYDWMKSVGYSINQPWVNPKFLWLARLYQICVTPLRYINRRRAM